MIRSRWFCATKLADSPCRPGGSCRRSRLLEPVLSRTRKKGTCQVSPLTAVGSSSGGGLVSAVGCRVPRAYGNYQATLSRSAKRQEGAGRRSEQTDPQEPAEEHADRARQGGRGRAARRLAHAQGARGASAQAEHQRPLEDGQGPAQARRGARQGLA